MHTKLLFLFRWYIGQLLLLGADLNNNWTGPQTLMPCMKKDKAASVCWGDWGPWEWSGHYSHHFCDTMVASAMICWGCGSSESDRNKIKASSLLETSLNTIEDCVSWAFVHKAVAALSSPLSSRLLQPWCKKEYYHPRLCHQSVSNI